jgi:hypothetical protein
VSQVLPLSQTPQALNALLQRKVVGKMVLRPDL